MSKEQSSKAGDTETTANHTSVRQTGPARIRGGLSQFVKRILRVRETAMVLLILGTMLIMSLSSPYFFSLTNFAAIARGFSMEGLVVIGMSLLLVAGKFDLSVGSVMALSGIVSAWLMVKVGLPMTLSAAGGLLAGFLTGLVNGLVVTRLKVNPLIATLGMMSIARGMALGFTEGRPVINVPIHYAWLGQGSLFGIPVPFLIMLFMILIVDILLRRGRLLRQLYYIGGNEKAAKLTGINVDRVVLFTFAASGFFAAMGGIISMARLQSGVPTAFVGVELRIIAACVIGGMSLSGGEGTIVGALLGLVFMALVANAMTLFGVSIYWEGVVTGSILVIAVSLDMISRKRFRRGS